MYDVNEISQIAELVESILGIIVAGSKSVKFSYKDIELTGYKVRMRNNMYMIRIDLVPKAQNESK